VPILIGTLVRTHVLVSLFLGCGATSVLPIFVQFDIVGTYKGSIFQRLDWHRPNDLSPRNAQGRHSRKSSR